jgi:two-component system, cell cycle response regulator
MNGAEDLTRTCVLVVDDDEEDRKLITRILEYEGYATVTADSGAEAVAVAEEQEVHIVLLDLLMPGMDGYEVCQQIRKMYYQRPLQIVLVSGIVDEPELAKAIEIGGDDFIKKPITALELQARMKAAQIRLRNQVDLLKEREYYRQAVKQEEELSSRILDQNIYLKKAYKNVANVNKELEKANRQLETVARYDMLSGLLNRMSLFAMIDAEIERALRTELPLSGIMLDIDHFKMINDNYGHQCGDVVIRGIGKLLKERLRKYDHAGRYGGEEFFIILPNTSMEQAELIGERFRAEVLTLKIQCTQDDLGVTASLGVAEFRPGESREKWISRADRAMYNAKQQGRNRVNSE